MYLYTLSVKYIVIMQLETYVCTMYTISENYIRTQYTISMNLLVDIMHKHEMHTYAKFKCAVNHGAQTVRCTHMSNSNVLSVTLPILKVMYVGCQSLTVTPLKSLCCD